MLKGFSKDAVYYALIIIFLSFTLYFLSPALFRQAPANPGPSIITTPLNYTLVNLVILTSSECKALCDYTGVEAGLRRLFVNLKVNVIDVNTAEGRSLVEQLNLSIVPAYIFDSSLEKNPAYNSTRTYFRKSGNEYLLNTVDASSGYLINNEPSASPQIVQFITTYDRNSLKFQNTTFNVLTRLNSSINFSVHYVVNIENDSFKSVNGYIELVEAAIQLCALQSGSPNALNAVVCRSRDILQCYNESAIQPAFCAQFWKLCVDGWGINSSQVDECRKTQNSTLLGREAAISAENKINIVPTTFIGGKYKLVGSLSEFELFSTICAIYPSLEGCTIRVETQTTVNTSAVNASVANSSSTGSN